MKGKSTVRIKKPGISRESKQRNGEKPDFGIGEGEEAEHVDVLLDNGDDGHGQGSVDEDLWWNVEGRADVGKRRRIKG